MLKLLDNYNNRVKKFIYQMADTPIVVKEKNEKDWTTKETYQKENSSKILHGKGFVFTSYKSDKERLQSYITENSSLLKQFLFNNNNKIKSSDKQKRDQDQLFTRLANNQFHSAQEGQDLKKLYELLKNKPVLEAEEKVLLYQLNKLGIHKIESPQEKMIKNASYVYHTCPELSPEDLIDTDMETYHINTEQNKNENELKYEYIRLREQDLRNKRYKTQLEKERQKNVMLMRHYKKMKKKRLAANLNEFQDLKTHFKATENYIMFNTSTVDHNAFEAMKKADVENQRKYLDTRYSSFGNFNRYNRSSRNYYSAPKINQTKSYCVDKDLSFRNKPSKFILKGNKKLLGDLNVEREIANTNPLLFNINFNTGHIDNNHVIDRNEFNNLRELAFEKEEEDEDSENNELKDLAYEDPAKKEDNVYIDGEKFKKSDVDKIGSRILIKCKMKGKDQKNIHKVGEGKLMFTNGMTLNEFESKFGL